MLTIVLRTLFLTYFLIFLFTLEIIRIILAIFVIIFSIFSNSEDTRVPQITEKIGFTENYGKVDVTVKYFI